MPCIPCNNGKYKYGHKGRCQYDSRKECEQAAKAIHADKQRKRK